MPISQRDLDFKTWIQDPQFPNLKSDRAKRHARLFIDRIKNDELPKPLYSHQQLAVLNVIFEGEVQGNWATLLNIVTGGGKTVIMATLVAYFWQVHEIEKFLILTPNTIVRERVKDDFERGNPGFAYEHFPLFFNSYRNVPDKLVCKVLRGHGDEGSIRDANVIVSNIHQVYEGREALEVLLSEESTPPFVLFNDEAHNAKAHQYSEVLKLLREKTHARVDLTATPYRLDKEDLDTYPPVYSYDIVPATRDRVVKQTLVTRPDIEKVKLQYEEWDDEDNVVRTLDAKDMPWEEIEAELSKSGAVKFVTAKHARKQHLQIAESCLDYQRNGVELAPNGEREWEPLMMVVALSRRDAEEIHETLQKAPFKYKKEELLLVHHKQQEIENKKAFLLGRTSPEGLDKADAKLWEETRKVRIIIGVGMLREGWDVRNICVICLFRKFSYQLKGDRKYTVYGPQIIGRGLRKIHQGKTIDHLFVTDHPAFNHDWLWEMLGSEVYARSMNPGDEVDEKEVKKLDAKLGDPETNQELFDQQGHDLPGLDVEDVMSAIERNVSIDPIKDWQKHFRGLQLKKKIGSAQQVITNVKTKVVGNDNTAHELPDSTINTPELLNTLKDDSKKTKEEKIAEIRSELEELPRQAVFQTYRQVTAEQIQAMNMAIQWILRELFNIENIENIEASPEKDINKLHFALDALVEELNKPEIVLGVLGET